MHGFKSVRALWAPEQYSRLMEFWVSALCAPNTPYRAAAMLSLYHYN